MPECPAGSFTVFVRYIRREAEKLDTCRAGDGFTGRVRPTSEDFARKSPAARLHSEPSPRNRFPNLQTSLKGLAQKPYRGTKHSTLKTLCRTDARVLAQNHVILNHCQPSIYRFTDGSS